MNSRNLLESSFSIWHMLFAEDSVQLFFISFSQDDQILESLKAKAGLSTGNFGNNKNPLDIKGKAKKSGVWEDIS